MPEALVDGSPRSRCVTWGVPIVYRIELAAKLPMTHVSFICSSQAGESPKDIELRLSDGTVIKHTLASLQEWTSPRGARRWSSIRDCGARSWHGSQWGGQLSAPSLVTYAVRGRRVRIT